VSRIEDTQEEKNLIAIEGDGFAVLILIKSLREVHCCPNAYLFFPASALLSAWLVITARLYKTIQSIKHSELTSMPTISSHRATYRSNARYRKRNIQLFENTKQAKQSLCQDTFADHFNCLSHKDYAARSNLHTRLHIMQRYSHSTITPPGYHLDFKPPGRRPPPD